ncbi:hypothetical protein [Glaciibacter superstes]|uniref:hypothetical protein n=1 Tax=Glaciibacter superstes TaxID=501023 RepID=UPI0003B50551|nr:hypothetical protein [Glaciibacter superstes]
MSAATDATERKVRDLVEQAGFELAINLDRPGNFRIVTKADWSLVAVVNIRARGFVAVFPGRQIKATDATDLVDVLEAIKAEGAGK